MDKTEFKIEDIVYLKTDPEAFPRVITRYTVSKGSVTYELALCSSTSWHYSFEFTSNKEDLIKSIGFPNANTERGQ